MNFSRQPLGITDARLKDAVAQTPAFVSSTSMTVAQLLANFPATASLLGKYARVTDLYGSADEVMRCCSNGSVHYWRPQRTDYAQAMGQDRGTVSLLPLFTPPQIRMTAALGGALTITPSTVNAWPGCTFDVTMTGLLGIFSATITGLVGASIPLLTGATKRLVYDGSGFYAQ